MRYLAIGAHPDDLEIKCFGTLCRLKAEGHYIAVCNIANGCLGSVTIPPDELSVIRSKEAKASAESIGAEHFEVLVNDMEVNSHDQEAIKRLAEVIRIARPDVIFTMPPVDYHPDHYETSYLVIHASFTATLPNFKTDHPYLETLPYTYYYESSDGFDFEPTEFVDVTEYIDKKVDALKCHKSQLEWLSAHDNVDIGHKTRITAAYRGMQCGVEYAEAFRVCLKSGRVPAKRVLP